MNLVVSMGVSLVIHLFIFDFFEDVPLVEFMCLNDIYWHSR